VASLGEVVSTWRFWALLALWLVLGGSAAEADLAMGVVAAVLATKASLRLAPLGPGGMRPVALALILLRLPWQMARAGVEVAWRALHPGLPILPGALAYAPRLGPGVARDVFLTLSSLEPGTLPAGDHPDGGLAIHALDGTQPVVEIMERREARFVRAAREEGPQDA
jgi:multicomponent Na+:H+ antiporter subunit E